MNILEKMYAIRDSRSECFPNQPFLQKSHGEAERTFITITRNPETLMNKYPDDYDLYFLGEFNTKTGVLVPLDTPQHMIKASMLPKN